MKKLSETYKELGIAFEFPIRIKDKNGKETYYENSADYWSRLEFDERGNDKDKERLDWLLDDDTRVVIELVYKEGEKTMLDYLESREDIDRAIRSNK